MGAVVGKLRWNATDKDLYYQEKIKILAEQYGLEWLGENHPYRWFVSNKHQVAVRVSGLYIYLYGGKESIHQQMKAFFYDAQQILQANVVGVNSESKSFS